MDRPPAKPKPKRQRGVAEAAKAARAARGAVKAAKAAIKDWSDEQAKRESVVATKSKKKSKKELLSILKDNPDLCPGLLQYAKFLRYEKEQKSASTQHGPSDVEQQVVAAPPTKKRRRGREVGALTIPKKKRKRAEEEQQLAASEPMDGNGGRSIAKVEDQRPRVRHEEDTGAASTPTEHKPEEEQKHAAVSNPEDCGVLAKVSHAETLWNRAASTPTEHDEPEEEQKHAAVSNPWDCGVAKVSHAESRRNGPIEAVIDKGDGIPKQAIHIYLGVSGH